jgi:hypothetical protein
VFACDVDARAGKTLYASDGRHVDDGAATTLFDHLLYFIFQAEPRAFEIDVNGLVPFFFGLLDDRDPMALDARVVEGIVKAPKSRDSFFNQGFDFGCTRHIRLDKDSFTPGASDQVHRSVSFRLAPSGYHHPGAFPGEQNRCLPPDA